MTDTTASPQQSATPPAGGQPPATTPAAPAAPAETPSAPATNGQGGTPQQPAGQPAAGQGEPKFTQADLDRIINERLDRQQDTFRKQFAAAFGIEDPNAPKDPAELAKAAQARADSATTFAVDTLAEAVALSAGIKPDRVPVFLAVAKQAGLLGNVDLANPAEARTALTAALTAKAGEFPEWKTGAAVAPSSGGDRAAPQDTQRRWTKTELDNMSHAEMEKNLPEIQKAMAEGRVDFNR